MRPLPRVYVEAGATRRQLKGALSFLIGGAAGLIFPGIIVASVGGCVDLIIAVGITDNSTPDSLPVFGLVGWWLSGLFMGAWARSRTLKEGAGPVPDERHWERVERRIWQEEQEGLPEPGALSAAFEAAPEGQLSISQGAGLSLTEREPPT